MNLYFCVVGNKVLRQVYNSFGLLLDFRYPYDEAATVAISTIKEFCDDLKEVISRFCSFPHPLFILISI